MRHFCTAAVVLSIASLTTGCQQAPNASSTLTPVGTLSPPPQLAPVSGTTSGVGPFGAPTRIPPPGTGSYTVPNNYMGGTAEVGQVGVRQPADSFRSSSGVQAAAFANAPATSGVATSPIGTGFATQPAPHPAQAPLQPQLGGMRVHDLTGAPLPPGYRGGSSVTPNQPAANQVPAGFTPNPIPNTQPPAYNSSAPLQIPSRIPGADVANHQANNQQSLSIAQRHDAGLPRELPIQPSPLQPSFNSGSQFQSQPPSTDPINNQGGSQPQDLPWRRPTAAY